MRGVFGLALVMVFAVGCGQSAGSAGGPACPAIGTPVGIGLDVPAASATGITGATVQACWSGHCVTRQVQLVPSSAAGPTTCASGEPDSACSATATPTGGLNGFADIPGLPAAPVLVTVTFNVGKAHTLNVTPAYAQPGGPGCGQSGPQAQLTGGADRVVQAR